MSPSPPFTLRAAVAICLSALLALAATACTTSSEPAADLQRFYDQQLTFEPCQGYATTVADETTFAADPAIGCARLELPLDYDEPDGRTAQIALLKAPARGECFSDEQTDAGGATQTLLVGAGQWTEQDTRRIVEQCAQGSGGADVLAHVCTRDAARDMDILRAALGDDKLSYLGQSYGTRLGAVYAEMFPQNVRAMVLDGAIDPQLGTAQRRISQYTGFQLSLTRWPPSAPQTRSARSVPTRARPPKPFRSWRDR
ncbi:alpha/beta fold hydrolase [Williamsia sp.]|uniref:alpha/beta fold hydrolase n=1 Tax=Williamsia sp. TaxID=1872085 RepID=UPI002F93A96A